MTSLEEKELKFLEKKINDEYNAPQPKDVTWFDDVFIINNPFYWQEDCTCDKRNKGDCYWKRLPTNIKIKCIKEYIFLIENNQFL